MHIITKDLFLFNLLRLLDTDEGFFLLGEQNFAATSVQIGAL